MSSRSLPVCLRCGNRDIRPQTIREGLWPGGGEAMGLWTCDRCGFTGQPLLMEPQDVDRLDPAERWDTSPAASPPTVAPHADPPRRPVAGALLLFAASMFLVPIYLVAVAGFLTGDPGAVLGGLGVSGLSLLLGVAIGRTGWRMIRPAPGAR